MCENPILHRMPHICVKLFVALTCRLTEIIPKKAAGCNVVNLYCILASSFHFVQTVEVKPQVVVKPIQPPVERPSADEPLTHLTATVSNSLKQALANKLQQMKVSDDKAEGIVSFSDIDEKPGYVRECDISLSLKYRQ